MVRDMNLSRIMRFGLILDRKLGTEVNETRRARFVQFEAFRCFVLLLLLTSIVGCTQKPSEPVSRLEQVKRSGELRVATRYGPSSYYEGPDGPAGLEHDLAQLFAKRLGVKVKFVTSGSVKQVIRTVADGKADLAAAGLIMGQNWKNRVRFAPPYRRVTEQILYSRDRPPPRDLADISRGVLEVPSGSSHLATLKQLRRRHRDLTWRVSFDHNAGDLAYLVSRGLVDFTVAHSDQGLLMRRYYPKLQVAFDIGKARELAWALPISEDASLHDEVARFFEDIRRDKTLDQLIDRYYGHAEAFDPALDSSLRRDYRSRLPSLKPLFVRAGEQHNIDWRLLAAIAYQESKWKSNAVSPEGVRGLMMLTGVTAREVKVRDRFDPAQSIAGGAFYLKQTLANIPADIQNPDRVWYALAAYNLGPGHVEDARNLVRSKGGDPDKWIEIKQVLPLLGKQSWYRKTKYGRARGSVAVHYVNSIRRYYDLLVWITEAEEKRRLTMGLKRTGADGV
jgi:membrane-bound lytic murein transglycosylase F